MIISVWDEVAQKRSSLPQKELFEYVSSITMELFMPLLDEYKAIAKPVLLYILHAYSKDSKLVISGASWVGNKKVIADKVDLPDHLYDEVVHLRNKVFRQVVTSYLDFQSDRKFKHLQTNKDIYEAMSNSIMIELNNEEGTLDFKSLNEKRKYKDELLEAIDKLEEDMREEYNYSIFTKEEADKAEKTSKGQSLNIENSEFVKQ